MRKLSRDLENPLDNVIIDLCEQMNPFFSKLHMTPNDITTLSLITGLLSIIFIYKGFPVVAVIFYFLSYVFDCADGFYARRYKMCSKGGDLYDHVKDWVVNILYAYVLYYKYSHKLTKHQWMIVVGITVFLLVMQSFYFASQECYYGKLDQIPSLSWLGGLVKNKNNAKNILSFVRYFGCGTYILYVIGLTLYLEYKK